MQVDARPEENSTEEQVGEEKELEPTEQVESEPLKPLPWLPCIVSTKSCYSLTDSEC